jgi:hypothetical protein
VSGLTTTALNCSCGYNSNADQLPRPRGTPQGKHIFCSLHQRLRGFLHFEIPFGLLADNQSQTSSSFFSLLPTTHTCLPIVYQPQSNIAVSDMVSGTSLPICRRFLFSRGRPCNLTLIIAVIVLIWVFGFISVPRREEHAISVAIPATGPVTVLGTTITTTPPSAPVALPDFEAPLHVRTEDVYNTTLGVRP